MVKLSDLERMLEKLKEIVEVGYSVHPTYREAEIALKVTFKR